MNFFMTGSSLDACKPAPMVLGAVRRGPIMDRPREAAAQGTLVLVLTRERAGAAIVVTP
jgi:hypothetical protein